jgi:hypothetical protein
MPHFNPEDKIESWNKAKQKRFDQFFDNERRNRSITSPEAESYESFLKRCVEKFEAAEAAELPVPSAPKADSALPSSSTLIPESYTVYQKNFPIEAISSQPTNARLRLFHMKTSDNKLVVFLDYIDVDVKKSYSTTRTQTSGATFQAMEEIKQLAKKEGCHEVIVQFEPENKRLEGIIRKRYVDLGEQPFLQEGFPKDRATSEYYEVFDSIFRRDTYPTIKMQIAESVPKPSEKLCQVSSNVIHAPLENVRASTTEYRSSRLGEMSLGRGAAIAPLPDMEKVRVTNRVYNELLADMGGIDWRPEMDKSGIIRETHGPVKDVPKAPSKIQEFGRTIRGTAQEIIPTAKGLAFEISAVPGMNLLRDLGAIVAGVYTGHEGSHLLQKAGLERQTADYLSSLGGVLVTKCLSKGKMNPFIVATVLIADAIERNPPTSQAGKTVAHAVFATRDGLDAMEHGIASSASAFAQIAPYGADITAMTMQRDITEMAKASRAAAVTLREGIKDTGNSLSSMWGHFQEFAETTRLVERTVIPSLPIWRLNVAPISQPTSVSLSLSSLPATPAVVSTFPTAAYTALSYSPTIRSSLPVFATMSAPSLPTTALHSAAANIADLLPRS